MTHERNKIQSNQIAPDDLIDLEDLYSVKKGTPESDADRKDRIANKATDVYGKFAVAYSLAAKVLDIVHIGLKAIPMVGYVIDGIELLLATLVAASGVIKKDGKWRSRIKTTAGLALIAVAIASLAAPEAALVVFIISASVGFFQSIWNFGAAFISRLTGSWKKEADTLKSEEAEFNQLLANEPRGLKVLEQARHYAVVEHQLKEHNEQIKQVEEKISVREKKWKENHYWENDLSDEEFDKALELEMAKDQVRLDLIEQKEELIKLKDNDPNTDFRNSMKEDFLDHLSVNEKRIIELDRSIHQRRNNLQERKSDIASDVVSFISTSVAVAGAALIFTPLAPIGGLMILGALIFSVARQFDIPGKWATRLSNYLFEPKKVESFESIQRKAMLLDNSPSTSASLLKKLGGSSSPSPVHQSSPSAELKTAVKSENSGFWNGFKFFKNKPSEVEEESKPILSSQHSNRSR